MALAAEKKSLHTHRHIYSMLSSLSIKFPFGSSSLVSDAAGYDSPLRTPMPMAMTGSRIFPLLNSSSVKLLYGNHPSWHDPNYIKNT